MSQLEALLTVRQPTATDLATLVPHVKFEHSDEDDSLVLRGLTNQGSFKEDMQKAEGVLKQLQVAQLDLFKAILGDNTTSISSKLGTTGTTTNKAAAGNGGGNTTTEDEEESDVDDDDSVPELISECSSSNHSNSDSDSY